MTSSEGGLRPCHPLGLEDQEQTAAHSPGEAPLRFLCPPGCGGALVECLGHTCNQESPAAWAEGSGALASPP